MARIASTGLNAATLVDPGGVEHAEMTALGLPPGGWVALSMIVVVLILIWKKAPRLIAAGLDRQIASIRVQLDEASKLLAEAEALRAEYAAKSAAAAGDVRSIVEHAHAEAAGIVAKAEADAASLIARRGRIAEDKIAAAERAAVAELRAKTATLAAAAAARLIADRHGAEADRMIVDRTIAGLGQRPN